jgi:hypothetical protein
LPFAVVQDSTSSILEILMSMFRDNLSMSGRRPVSTKLDTKLAAYLGAAGATVVAAKDAQAVVVSHTTIQPFGINEEVNIDLNSDGQIDWQIDHDRVNLDGTDLDYLQIDKNDINSAENPLPVDSFEDLHYQTFPLNGTDPNNDAAVLSFTNDLGDIGGYAVALKPGDVIGGSYENPTGSFVPGTIWDFQEGSNFAGTGAYIRANRLIDEDAGQIDADAGNSTLAPDFPFGPVPEFPDVEGWTGLNGEVRYLGVRVDLNDVAEPGLNNNNPETNPDFHQHFWYGWIGIRITNDEDATGEVVGWAYESEVGASIIAGDTGPVDDGVPGDYNDDGVVNAADYVVWRNNEGTAFTLPNEDPSATTQGTVDQEDYDFWVAEFGNTGAAGVSAANLASAVPEPSSLLVSLVTGATLILALLLRRFRS